MRRSLRRAVSAVSAMCLCAGTAACAAEPDPDHAPATRASTGATAPSVATWLAGIRIERDPDALDPDTEALIDVLGDALVVSPTSCFRGLPPDVGSSDYVLGAVAPSRGELDDLVSTTERDPLFEVEVEVLCTD